MRYYIILFIFYAIINTLAAQTDSSNILNWADKRLEWSDFQGSPVDYSLYHSELNFTIGYSTKTYLVEDTKVTALISYCYMDRGTSWVKKENMNDKYLIYNQIQFNLAELYSRKLQTQLFLLLNEKKERRIEAFTLILEINLDCQQRIDQLNEQTEYGNDFESVKVWAEEIEKELKQTPRKRIPDFENRKVGVGLCFDLGVGTLTNTLNRYFSNNFNLAFGFDLAYLDCIFFLRATLGFCSVKKDIEYKNRQWPEKLSTGLAIGDLAIGYPLIDNKKSRIIPFAGINYINFSPLSNQDKYEEHHIGKFAYSLGLNYDYKLIKTINIMSTFNEKSAWFIRTRVYVSFVNYNDQLRGTSINFTVGFGGFVRFLRIK